LIVIASFINLYKQLIPWKDQNLEEEMAIETPLLNTSTVTYGMAPESLENNATTVTRKTKSTVIRRTDSNESEGNAPPSFISFLEDVKQFSGYAWPHEKSIVKTKIIICAVLIFISTLISLSIPIQVGFGVDALNQGTEKKRVNKLNLTFSIRTTISLETYTSDIYIAYDTFKSEYII
jgi:heme/copper-type cytochrome/quinol oxidase subunit 3